MIHGYCVQHKAGRAHQVSLFCPIMMLILGVAAPGMAGVM
jgi:hypothetical protein